jgi:hypothetical protein
MNILNDLHQKFINGCITAEPPIDINDLINYRYAGGDSSSHYTYYAKSFFPNVELLNLRFPPHKDKCLCNHDIIRNFYIKKIGDNNPFYVVGSCCIKKFLPSGFRKSCIKCFEPTRNHKDFICNECRKTKCGICDIEIKTYKKLCNECEDGHCIDCFKDINPNYIKCYHCNIKNKK